MKTIAKAALNATAGALMLAGASIGFAAPASADVDVGISFGDPVYGFDPCDYYDYYDEPPPWGLPQDYCDYPVYFEPVFFDGYWYRGPIFYRWTHGRRLFWINGGWRADSWRGPRPARITWNNHGAHLRGFRPGIGFHGGGHDWRGGDRHWHDNGGDHGRWTGTNGPWLGNRGGGTHGGFGDHGFGGGGHGSFGDHGFGGDHGGGSHGGFGHHH